MTAVGAILLIASMLVAWSAPRRWALIGIMFGTLYLTQAQTIDVGGFNLYAFRMIEVVGFIRVMVRREFSFSNLNRMDWGLLTVYIYSTIIFVARSDTNQFNQIGTALDAVLTYFMFRGLVGGYEEFSRFLQDFLILLAPYTLIVLVESFTHYNLFFASMGSGFITASAEWTRGGRIRCFGSFRHSSLLGTLGACFIPLYVGLGYVRANRKAAGFGIGLCLLIVYASNSGGPLNCVAIGVLSLLFWKQRTRMRLIRGLLVAFFVVVAMVMKAPIWYLPARASSLTGGDGWHRSYLMDMAMKNIDKWWLNGMPIQATANWFPYELGSTGGADITNQFLAFALTAGVIAMFLFIRWLVLAFSALGKAEAVLRADGSGTYPMEFMLWGLGAMLVAHIFNWFGITYFDQTASIWFMQMAAIANLSDQVLAPSPAETADGIPESTDIAEAEDVAPHAV